MAPAREGRTWPTGGLPGPSESSGRYLWGGSVPDGWRQSTFFSSSLRAMPIAKNVGAQWPTKMPHRSD